MIRKLSLKNKYAYIIVAIALLIVIYFPFLSLDKMYIYNDVGSDTLDSYIPIYNFIIDKLKNGGFKSTLMLEMGIGTSVFTLTSFFVDPLIVILLVFPDKYFSLGVLTICLVKYILIYVIAYNFFKKIGMSSYTSLISSILWTFSSYNILWGQHYHFLNAVLSFTLIMYCFELYFRDKRCIPLILSVSFALMNSLYFSYMIVIFFVVYSLVRVFLEKYNLQEIIRFYLKLFSIIIFAILLSAVIVFPNLNLLINNSRAMSILEIPRMNVTEITTIIANFYSKNILGLNEYYGWRNTYESPNIFTSNAVNVVILYTLINRNVPVKNKLLCCLPLIIFINPLTFLFNKFAAYNYRWTFILTFMNILVFSIFMESILSRKQELDKRAIFITGIVLSLIFILNMSYFGINLNSNKLNYWLVLIFIWIFCDFVLNKNTTYFKLGWACFIILELLISSYQIVNYRELVDYSYYDEKQGYYDYSNDAIEYIKSIDDDLFRIEKGYNSRYLNDSLMQDYYGFKIYNSMNNPSYSKFNQRLGYEMQVEGNSIVGFEEDVEVSTFLGQKYYLSKGEKHPYGYELIHVIDEINIYRNLNYLGFGINMNNCVEESDVIKFDNLGRRDKLLEYAVIGNSIIPESTLKMSTNGVNVGEINLDMKSDINAHLYDNIEFNNKLEERGYKFDKNEHSDLYIKFNKPLEYINLKLKFKDQTTGNIYVKTSTNELNDNDREYFVTDQNGFLQIELNYEEIEYIRLSPLLNEKDTIFENFDCEEMDYNNYKNNIAELKNKYIQIDARYENASIIMQNEVSESGTMVVPIPYDKNWVIKVNDNIVEYFEVDYGLVGFFIPKDESVIEIKYVDQTFKIGVFTTIVTLLLYTGISILKKYKHKT